MLSPLLSEIQNQASLEKAKIYARFFKCGPGQYGEGDQFLGLTVPQSRSIAKKYLTLSEMDLEKLLLSSIHEHRLIALLILVEKFKKADEDTKKDIVHFYLAHTTQINNWDLVDLSADKILGNYLLDKDRAILYRLVRSSLLWERRISIITTFAFIRQKQFGDTFKLAELLLNDKQDLMHKAVGWMLREVGKRDEAALERFLQKHYRNMPRTTLRYAIERFDKEKKKRYMGK